MPRLGVLVKLAILVAGTSLLLLSACAAPVGEATRGAPLGFDPALDFPIIATQGLPVLEGSEAQFSTLFDQGKPIVLNFWAGNCPPCRAEMPDFQRIHEAYSDRVLIIGLDVGPFVGLGSHEDGLHLLRQLGVTYPAGTTSDANVVRAYTVSGMPTTAFFTAEGKLLTKRTGLVTSSQVLAILEQIWQGS